MKSKLAWKYLIFSFVVIISLDDEKIAQNVLNYCEIENKMNWVMFCEAINFITDLINLNLPEANDDFQYFKKASDFFSGVSQLLKKLR